MAFNREAAKQAGYSDQEIDAYLASKTTSSGQVQEGTDFMSRLSGFAPLANTLTMGGVEGVKESVGKQQRRFQQPQSLTDVLNPVKQAQNFGEDVIQPIALPALKIAGVYKMLPWLFKNVLTRGGIARLTEKTAKVLTKKGTNLPMEGVKYNIREAVTKKFGETEEVIKPLEELISETSQKVGSKINPSQLLDWRKQVGARLGSKNYLQRIFQGTDIGEKVAGTARSTISKEIQKISPAIKTLDKVYGTQSKLYPLLKGALIYELIKRSPIGRGLGKLLGGLF